MNLIYLLDNNRAPVRHSMWGLSFYSKRVAIMLGVFILALGYLPAPALGSDHFDTDYKEKINGTTLHFRVRGVDEKNPYLLILHGGPGFSAHMFYTWGPSLEQTVNVVYLDQRGSGESERLKLGNPFAPKKEEVKDYTIANLINDIEGVRTFLKVDKWYVLGHSWGGMLGIEYAAAHPEHIAGYIHMDGLLSQPMAQDALLDFAETQYKTQSKSGDAAGKEKANGALKSIVEIRKTTPNLQRLMGAFTQIRPFFAQVYYAHPDTAGAYNKQIADAIKEYHVPLTALSAMEPAVALDITDHYTSRDESPLLTKITVPTLIINGRQDGIIPPKTAEKTHRGIAGSELLLLDDCGHFPFMEQPAKTTAALLDFFKKHPVQN